MLGVVISIIFIVGVVCLLIGLCTPTKYPLTTTALFDPYRPMDDQWFEDAQKIIDEQCKMTLELQRKQFKNATKNQLGEDK